jgi:hypothetical protein
MKGWMKNNTLPDPKTEFHKDGLVFPKVGYFVASAGHCRPPLHGRIMGLRCDDEPEVRR